MKYADKLALVTDYIRSKDNPDCYINDQLGIVQVGRTLVQRVADAIDYLDTIETMNFEAIGRIVADQLIDAYLDKAIEWKAERRAA